jgi:ABC-type nitrate/sulfonate/bicarbonate transport system substrate-binding protein
MRGRATAAREMFAVWAPLVLIVTAGFLVAYRYVGAPPPRVIRIATGAENGAYHAFAKQYAQLLARDGLTLEVVPTAGTVDNLALLRRGDVSLALVQGGCASEADRLELQSLGSLFLEAVWVFTPRTAPIRRLNELTGKRVAVGPVGSGTQLLAKQLLRANGVHESNATFIHVDTSDVGGSLVRGELDAAIVVASAEAPIVHALAERPELELLDLERTGAYGRVFPFLTPLTLDEGVLNLERNIPPRETRLVGTAASLAARHDLHPALIPALLDAATRVHQTGGLLEETQQFPSANLADLPVNADASRYIRNGPSLLYRWVPYGTAVVLDRLKVLLLPLVALLLPLFRVAPPLYQWRVRSRVYRWYAAVRDIDLAISSDEPDLASLRSRLHALESEVASISVPLAYTGEQYHLRLHIHLLQEELDRRENRAKTGVVRSQTPLRPV